MKKNIENSNELIWIYLWGKWAVGREKEDAPTTVCGSGMWPHVTLSCNVICVWCVQRENKQVVPSLIHLYLKRNDRENHHTLFGHKHT